MKNEPNKENGKRKYKVTRKVVGGAIVLGLFATGLKGCSDFLQERMTVTKEKETDVDLDTEQEENTTEVESTTIVETEEYSEEETSYGEWEVESTYTEDLGQASRNIDTDMEKEAESTIVEIETEVQTDSEIETEPETQKETEPESSSSGESEPNSESSEEDKSEEEHEHNFKTISTTYLDNSSAEYHYKTIKKKCECGETKTSKKKELHDFTDFVSIGKDGEEQHCKKCEHEEIIAHDVTTYSIFTNNENGTHTQNNFEKCTRDYCDYEGLLSQTVGPHNCGDYVNAGDKGEESRCQSEGCDYVQTRDHKEKKTVTYNSMEGHKHSAQTDTICENGCGYEIRSTKLEDCIHEKFTSNGVDYEVSVCPKCEDELKREHPYEKVLEEFYRNNDGTHVERIVYECPSCGEEKIEETLENCIGKWVSAGAVGESQLCTDCGATNTRDHNLKENSEAKYVGDGISHQHEVEIDKVCQNVGCGYEMHDSKKENCDMNYEDNGENELAKCPTCKKEVTREHNMNPVTRHKDNADGKTHTTTKMNICQNENCGHEDTILEETNNHVPSGSWTNNGEDGEKNTCNVDGCNGEMKRDHDLSNPATGTGEYHYIGNAQHVEGGEKKCANGCGYTEVVKEEDAIPENCDLTGPKNPAPNGEDITVTCPKCEHEEVVHTHNIKSEREKKQSYDPANHSVKQTCDALYTDGSACTYTNGPIDEPHNLVPTGVENTDERPGMREMRCETNENGTGCGEFVWQEMTNTNEQIEESIEEQTSVEIPEEENSTEYVESENTEPNSPIVEDEQQEDTTEYVESENTESNSSVVEDEQQEDTTEYVESENTETNSSVAEDKQQEDTTENTASVSETIVAKAEAQIVDEIAREVMNMRRNNKENNIYEQLTTGSEKTLAKKRKLMYTVYNEYMGKRRKNYC